MKPEQIAGDSHIINALSDDHADIEQDVEKKDADEVQESLDATYNDEEDLSISTKEQLSESSKSCLNLSDENEVAANLTDEKEPVTGEKESVTPVVESFSTAQNDQEINLKNDRSESTGKDFDEKNSENNADDINLGRNGNRVLPILPVSKIKEDYEGESAQNAISFPEPENAQNEGDMLFEEVASRPNSPKIVLTTPESKIVLLSEDRKNDDCSYRPLLRYDPNESVSEEKEEARTPSPYLKRSPSSNSNKEHHNYSYDNPKFLDFKTATQEYYQFLNQYHVADTLPIFNRTKLKIELRKHGIDHIDIALFGPPGCGKSALLNTMYYALNGNYLEYSQEGKIPSRNQQTSVTDNRLELKLTETITVLDNRGIDFSKESLKEVKKQCEGFREAGEEVPEDWNGSMKQTFKDFLSGFNKKLLLRNKVQCPLIVNSLKQEFDKESMKKLTQSIKESCRCNPVVVLTNVKDFKDGKISILQNRVQDFQELNCARIFTVENYTYKHHDKKQRETDETIVEALYDCCIVADQVTASILQKIEKGSCCSS